MQVEPEVRLSLPSAGLLVFPGRLYGTSLAKVLVQSHKACRTYWMHDWRRQNFPFGHNLGVNRTDSRSSTSLQKARPRLYLNPRTVKEISLTAREARQVWQTFTEIANGILGENIGTRHKHSQWPERHRLGTTMICSEHVKHGKHDVRRGETREDLRINENLKRIFKSSAYQVHFKHFWY